MKERIRMYWTKVSEEEKSRRRWLAPLLGAAAGAGTYALARKQFLGPAGSALRKMREASGGEMLNSRILDTQSIAQTDLSKLQKLVRLVKYGPEVDLYDPEVVKQLSKNKGKVPFVYQEGASNQAGTFNPAIGAPAGKKEFNALQDRLYDLSGDKYLEYEALQKASPGAMARTLNVDELFAKHNLKMPRGGKHRDADLKQLQEALKKEFGPAGFMVKTRGESPYGNVASSGIFPTDKTDFVEAYKQWKKMKPGFMRERSKSDLVNDAISKFRTLPGYEGRVIDDLLEGNVIFQEKLPLLKHTPARAEKMRARGMSPTKEYRVHVVGGRAIPYMSTPRYPSMSPVDLIELLKAQKASKWLQSEVLDKLPEAQRGMSFGVDVAPLEGGGFKVIELNPGGDSGLLQTIPGMPHLLHKAVTGRFSRPASAMLGGAAGLTTAGITGLSQD